MATEIALQGVTPWVLRTAAFYAACGCGEYYPKGYQFDRVVVSIKMPWAANTENPLQSILVLEVAFYAGPNRQRAIEFMLQPCGFSGPHIVKLVDPKLQK